MCPFLEAIAKHQAPLKGPTKGDCPMCGRSFVLRAAPHCVHCNSEMKPVRSRNKPGNIIALVVMVGGGVMVFTASIILGLLLMLAGFAFWIAQRQEWRCPKCGYSFDAKAV